MSAQRKQPRDRHLGQYHLVEIIGYGGMSTVYKAYQPSLERFVAVKVVHYNPDPQFETRFKREARAIAQLQHHNILSIYDYGEQDGLQLPMLSFSARRTYRLRYNSRSIHLLFRSPLPLKRYRQTRRS